MHRLEVILQSHVNLSLKQFIASILMSDVKQHVVALKEELLCLLLQHEALFFFNVYSALTLAYPLLHVQNLRRQRLVSLRLLLDLSLQSCEISDDLVAQLLTVLHLLPELLVLEGAARRFLVKSLLRLS